MKNVLGLFCLISTLVACSYEIRGTCDTSEALSTYYVKNFHAYGIEFHHASDDNSHLDHPSFRYADSVHSAQRFGLEISGDISYYLRPPRPRFSLFNSANACPSSEYERSSQIDNISITSNRALTVDIPAGEELRDYFSVLCVRAGEQKVLVDNESKTLGQYLKQYQKGFDIMHLALGELQVQGSHTFSIAISFADGKEFQFETGEIDFGKSREKPGP